MERLEAEERAREEHRQQVHEAEVRVSLCDARPIGWCLFRRSLCTGASRGSAKTGHSRASGRRVWVSLLFPKCLTFVD